MGLLLLASLARPQAEARPPATGRVYVLCYHTFVGRSDEYDVAPAEFARQIGEIKAMGYRFVSFPQLLAGEVHGDKNLLITIDDGNRSLLGVYANVLQRNDIEPLLFIYPAIIGRADYALTYPELKGLNNRGASIGSHGYYHLFLNQKTYNRSRRAFEDEFHLSKRLLREKLSLSNVEAFAFPFGVTSDLARAELRRAGYRYAFTIFHGAVRTPLAANEDPLRLPRYMVTKKSWNLISGILRRNARNSSGASENERQVRSAAPTAAAPRVEAQPRRQQSAASPRRSATRRPEGQQRRRSERNERSERSSGSRRPAAQPDSLPRPAPAALEERPAAL